MYRFNISIHARPPEAAVGPETDLGGLVVGTLTIPHDAISHPFGISFEAAMERLSGLERLFVEPDGSFFWGSPHDGPRWQLDGSLFDRNGRLLFVDLKGSCPAAEFDLLLSTLGWPETTLAFQLVREAVFLAEPEFRRWAEVSGAAGRG
jgi:hypothetical protein